MSDSQPQPSPKPPISGSIDLSKAAAPEPTPATTPATPPPPPTTATPAEPKPEPVKAATTPPPPPMEATSRPALPVKQSPFRFIIPIVAVVIILALVAFLISRFLGGKEEESPTSGGTPTEPIQITYWGLWEPTTVVQNLFTSFEQQNPTIKVVYEQQSHRDYRERLSSAIANGQGPDVFRFHNTWVPMLQRYLEVMPSTTMSAADFETTFYPVATSSLKTDKGIVGIPLMFEGLGLYYNKEMFAAAGKTPPTTWEELRRTAVQLTLRDSQGVMQRSGVALGTTGNVDNWSDILALLLLQNGADLSRPNSSLGQDALTFYTIFSKEDKMWDDTLPNSTYAFAIEKVAMILAPSWRAHEIRDINQELDFAVVPAPQLPGGEVNWASFWSEGVSSQSSRAEQEAAWKLLAYLSSKEVMREFYTAASNVRMFGEPFSRVDLADQLLGDPLVGAYIKSAPTAKSWFMASRTFDNGLNDRIIKYYEDAINAVNAGADEAEVLMTVEQGIAQVYGQYQE